MRHALGRPDPVSRRGSALILVLWSIALMAVLIGNFAFDAHVEGRITYYYRNRTKADYLARSGIHVARLIMEKGDEVAAESEDEESEFAGAWWYDVSKRLSDGLAVRGFEHALGEGRVMLDIVPEPARRNVNLLTERDWERLFEVSNVPEDYWPRLVESFQDWLDKDDDPRVDGAETEDFYGRLDPPYRAKNGPLDTVGELLLVRGFDRAILFGGALGEAEDGGDDAGEDAWMVTGIDDLLTIYGDGKVNINAASERVLRTLPGVDEIVAGAIIEEREGLLLEGEPESDTSFDSVSDLFRRIPEIDPSLSEHITTDSSIYRLTSVGEVGGVTRRIACIVERKGKQLAFLRWRED